MNSDRLWRSLTVLVAAIAVAGTAAAATTAGPTAAPLPVEGSSPPGAVAHRDDMAAGRSWTGTTTPAAPAPSTRQPEAVDDTTIPDAVDDTTMPEPRRPPSRLRVPVALQIPDLGVDSNVAITSMDENRSVLVPEDVLLTGWYDGSRRLGARQGSTVLVGHRDSASQGSGALAAIDQIPIGARVTVTGADGSRYAYAVETVELIDKANLPVESPRIFTRAGPHRLVLITCGGAFDAAAGSYLSNVVVTAIPVSSDLVPR